MRRITKKDLLLIMIIDPFTCLGWRLKLFQALCEHFGLNLARVISNICSLGYYVAFGIKNSRFQNPRKVFLR